MNKYKLSICIPTFNRKIFLEKLLESILHKINTSDVEISISDNCSTDGTEQYIKDLQEVYKNITYFKWKKNEGVDKNILKAVEIAAGEYIWLMGSDDLVPDNAIDQIKGSLGLNDIILIGRKEVTYNLKFIKNKYYLDEKIDTRIIHIENEKSIIDYFNACRALGGAFSFLGSVIIKRSRWKEVHIKSKAIGSLYVHVFIAISIMKSGARILYLKEPLIICRGGNDSFYINPASRALIDLNGYIIISEITELNQREKYALLGIIKYEHPLSMLVKMTAKIGFSVKGWSDWVGYMKSRIIYFKGPIYYPIISIVSFPFIFPLYMLFKYYKKKIFNIIS